MAITMDAPGSNMHNSIEDMELASSALVINEPGYLHNFLRHTIRNIPCRTRSTESTTNHYITQRTINYSQKSNKVAQQVLHKSPFRSIKTKSSQQQKKSETFMKSLGNVPLFSATIDKSTIRDYFKHPNLNNKYILRKKRR